jgi:hypothetical protein
MGVAALSDVAIAAGDPALARRLLPALARHGGRCLSWGVFGLIWEGPAVQFVGGLHLVLEQWAEAVPPLEQALATIESVGARPLGARVARDLAWALHRRDQEGDRPRARALIQEAARAAAALGMTHLEARIARTAADLSVGIATAVSAGIATDRTGGPAAARAAGPPVLSREGEVWAISWGGRQGRLKHSRGLEILEQLLRKPGQEFHVLSLGAADPGEAIDLGDAGELLDEAARAAYRARLADLERELAEAQVWADAGRQDRLRAELEFLSDELGRAVGLGGRARRAGAAVERARSNVQKRIRAVIRKLEESWPALASHLDSRVKTGIYVSYVEDV